MEKGLRTRAAGLLLCLAAAGAAAQEGPAKWIADFEKKFPPVEKNAAAEELERLGLALGLDPYGGAGDDHPLKEDRDAYLQAAFGTWLDSQVKVSDDSIALPPPRLAEFLEKRQASVWRVVTLLGREVPDWGFDAHRNESRPVPELLFVISLSRVMLSAALVEERAGHHMEAADLLEGSWSLYRSVASSPYQIFQLISLAVLKLQVGALRKLGEPAYGWVERLSNDAPKEQLLESLESEPVALLSRHDLPRDEMSSPWVRGWRAVVDGLRKLSACEISQKSDEEIWKPATEVIRLWSEAGGEPGMEVIESIIAPNLSNGFRRLARLMVDRELTLKILELRIEKSAARLSRWPAKFFDADSRVCPGAIYEYRSSGAGMSLRFAGSVADAGTPLVLPLSFEARAPHPTPGPSRTPSPTPTPTPRPSLTPARSRA
jgi:hypothetical protein